MIKTLLLILLIYLAYKIYILFRNISLKINQINETARMKQNPPQQDYSSTVNSDRIVDAEFTELKENDKKS